MNNSQRFVIQQHTKPDDLHWDLMLECDGVLQTYRLDKPPAEILLSGANAEKIFDHPMRFLTYQGTVNNGKGNVKIADEGTYQTIESSDNRIEFKLDGKILTGNFILKHIKESMWQFELLR